MILWLLYFSLKKKLLKVLRGLENTHNFASLRGTTPNRFIKQRKKIRLTWDDLEIPSERMVFPWRLLDRRAVLESVPIWLFVVFERKPDSFGWFTSEQWETICERAIHDSRRAGGVNGRLGEVAVMRLLPKSTRLPFVGAKRKGSVMLDKFRLLQYPKRIKHP